METQMEAEKGHCPKCRNTGVYIEPGGKTIPCDMEKCQAGKEQQGILKKITTNNQPDFDLLADRFIKETRDEHEKYKAKK